jgi:dTDP-4-amino-4,6-dideoxygalactose transaminase
VKESDFRDRLLTATNDANIFTRPVWTLMCDLAMYKNCQCGDLDNARWLVQRVVNLPSSTRIVKQ